MASETHESETGHAGCPCAKDGAEQAVCPCGRTMNADTVSDRAAIAAGSDAPGPKRAAAAAGAPAAAAEVPR